MDWAYNGFLEIFCKVSPRLPVILLAVRAREGSLVLNGAEVRSIGQEIVLDVLRQTALRQRAVPLPLAARHFQALARDRRPNDAAVLIVPSVLFVVAHDRKDQAIDLDQFVKGEIKGHGYQDIDLQQSLAADVVAAQGALSLPLRCSPLRAFRIQARMVACPRQGRVARS